MRRGTRVVSKAEINWQRGRTISALHAKRTQGGRIHEVSNL